MSVGLYITLKVHYRRCNIESITASIAFVWKAHLEMINSLENESFLSGRNPNVIIFDYALLGKRPLIKCAILFPLHSPSRPSNSQ
jgi:hypothetical protein